MKLAAWILPSLACLPGLALRGQKPDPRALRPQQEAAAPATERRVALLIGNGAYKESPLRNPANDARAMAAALKALGFEVQVLTDAGRKPMLDAVRTFGQKLAAGGVGLFYYAGHGMQVKGANYLIPVGVDITSEEDVQSEALDANTVLARMDAAKNRVNLVILDACRNNPFARSFRSGTRGLAQMEAPAGSFVAFATAPGSTAADGDGQNGLYTQHLLQALKEPGLTVEQVFKRVRVGVKAASRDQQVPWDSSSLTGEFAFRPGASLVAVIGGGTPPSPEPAPPPKPAGRSVDEWLQWQTAFDDEMSPLKRLAADTSRPPTDRLARLLEVQARWTEDNPHSDRDEAHRAWFKDQVPLLRVAESKTKLSRERERMNREGLAAWAREERERLSPLISDHAQGAAWLSYLSASPEKLSFGREPLSASPRTEATSPVDALVAQHVEALGGIEALNRVRAFRAIETYHKDGLLSVFYGGREPYDLRRTLECAPERIRVDVDTAYGNKGSTQAWPDREVLSVLMDRGWRISGGGSTFLPILSSPMPPATLPDWGREEVPAFWWEGPLTRWKELGGLAGFTHTRIPTVAWNKNGHGMGWLKANTELLPKRHPGGRLELLPTEPFPRTGAFCHKLRWTPRAGDPVSPVLFWLDAKTHLLVAFEQVLPSGETLIRVLSDWRPVEGIQLPHRSVQVIRKGTEEEVFEASTYTYEVNPVLPDTRFDLAQGAGPSFFPKRTIR